MREIAAIARELRRRRAEQAVTRLEEEINDERECGLRRRAGRAGQSDVECRVLNRSEWASEG